MNALVNHQDFATAIIPTALPAVAALAIPTLADLVAAVGRFAWLDRPQQAHVQGRLLRLARLLGDTPATIPLDVAEIGRRIEKVDRIVAGVSAKTISNIRWALITAVGMSGLVPGAPVRGRGHSKLTPRWQQLYASVDFATWARLSRLGHYASRKDAQPAGVDDQLVDDLMAEMKATSLRQNQRRLHRSIGITWNRLATDRPELGLSCIAVPKSLARRTRVPWGAFPQSFLDDLDRYLVWCAGNDPFSANAREKALNRESITTLKNHIHAGMSSLVKSGTVQPRDLRSLADFVETDRIRAILKFRHEAAAGSKNSMNWGVATALVQIAKDWVKVDDSRVKELRALARKVPHPLGEMTPRNRETIRAFDDPRVLRRLLELPDQLWGEVTAAVNPGKRTLAKAQAAICIALETYIPLRLRNLAALSFDTHLHLRSEPGATSTLEISGDEVKGHTPLAFDLPPRLAAMLIHYRDHLVPAVAGRRPTHVFVLEDGFTLKGRATVRYLLQAHLKRGGIRLNPHAFRHLAGKLILDREPGAHETVKQILGHNKIETTVNFYVGVDTRRAGRHHQQLLDERMQVSERSSRSLVSRP